LKLFLILLSLCIIYKGVMDTGDPNGFYSSTAVFYAMLLLDYYTQPHLFKTGFIKTARAIMMAFAGISGMGVLGLLTLREINGGFYVSFSDSMRLGKEGIINVHWLFLALSVASIIMSALELVFSIEKQNHGNAVAVVGKKKGA
jgi:hypothetical protein